MGCLSSTSKLKQEMFSYFKKEVKSKFLKYKFDSHLPDAFANRVAKENDVSLKTAKLWIKFYKFYMVYVGWLFNKQESAFQKPPADMSNYLIIPYEIIQVWREHILYTEKYSEFSRIVSNNSIDFIPFTPPKNLWKKQPIETLQKKFTKNKQMLSFFLESQKKEIETIFIFQSSYLKNLIHFYTKEENVNFNLLLNRYEEEMNFHPGLFTHNVRTLKALSEMADRLLEMISSTIKKEIYNGRREWSLQNHIQGEAKDKLEFFQNICLNFDFLPNFSQDHLLSYAKAELYLNEYKKFLFLAYVTKKPQSPSAEVDLVWHYHHTHVKDYLDFSALKMERKVFVHSPSTGKKEEGGFFEDVYKQTQQNLNYYFGYCNSDVWPDNTNDGIKSNSSSYKWFNHHTIMLKCFLRKRKICKLEKYESCNYVLSGCSMGCGAVMNGPQTIGCGTWQENTTDTEGVPSNCINNDWCSASGNCSNGTKAEKGRDLNKSDSSGCFNC